MQLILASSSPTRKAILEQMSLNFKCISPNIDETLHQDESVEDYVQRLAEEKAHAALKKLDPKDCPALIIGSDQVAHSAGKIYGKPKTLDRALAFFKELSNQKVEYVSGLTVFNSQTQESITGLSITEVTFKKLSQPLIEHYLKDRSVLECASGLKIEKMGPLLLKNFHSTDPSSILGLPILLLDEFVQQHGLNLFDFCSKDHVSLEQFNF
jgi:MAF protein